MTLREHRDLIEDLAASEASLRERLALAEASVVTWRMVAMEACHRGHEQDVEINRLERTVVRLREELRERMGIPVRAIADLNAERAA